MQREFEERRNAEYVEVQRLEEQERRRTEEKVRAHLLTPSPHPLPAQLVHTYIHTYIHTSVGTSLCTCVFGTSTTLH